MSSEDLLKELHSALTPDQFEKFLSVLMSEMGFSDVVVTAKPGDRGIDLRAIWTQSNVPGLEVDLPFVIQAKRFDPRKTLNPSKIRELRGTLLPGHWGLMITTAKVSSKTHEEGLADPSRVISVISGVELIELCKKYGIGVRADYKIDLSMLQEEEEAPQLEENQQETIAQKLNKTLKETFSRLGTSPIYQSKSMTVIARYSQYYEGKENYWFGTTPKDLDRVKKYGVDHYAFICAGSGVVIIPVPLMLQEIAKDNLFKTFNEEKQLRHYHVKFFESSNSFFWKLRLENRKIDELFHLNKTV